MFVRFEHNWTWTFPSNGDFISLEIVQTNLPGFLPFPDDAFDTYMYAPNLKIIVPRNFQNQNHRRSFRLLDFGPLEILDLLVLFCGSRHVILFCSIPNILRTKFFFRSSPDSDSKDKKLTHVKATVIVPRRIWDMKS